MKVIVVLPAFNAAKTLKATLERIPEEFKSDVVLVDDCSTDNTFELAQTLGVVEVVRHDHNRGYGANQKTCYTAAIEAGADIDEQNKYGFTALEYCVTQNKLDMVKALLSKGADVHRVNQNGNTVLHIIAESKSNRDEMLKCVVAKGADLESTNSHGQTALHLHALQFDRFFSIQYQTKI